MNELEQILKETDYTQEEYEIFRKVQRHFYAEDLQYMIEEKPQYKEIIENQADHILHKYDKWLDYDWRDTMIDAIEFVQEFEEEKTNGTKKSDLY